MVTLVSEFVIRRCADSSGNLYVNIDDLKRRLTLDAFALNDLLQKATNPVEAAATLGVREGITTALTHLDRIAEYVSTED